MSMAKRPTEEYDFAMGGKFLSNVDDLTATNRIEYDNKRTYSISQMNYETQEEKSNRIQELQQKLELSKFLLKTILDALYVTPKYVPTIIRIFLKMVSELYEKHSKINAKFCFKDSDNKNLSDTEKKIKLKSEIHRLLVDIIASKWLVSSLFIHPDKSGLIINKSIEKLSDILIKFSKIFVHSLRGKVSSKNISDENFMIMFDSFIKDHHKSSRNFVRSILNIKTDHLIPPVIKTEDDYLMAPTKREYSKSSMIEIFCLPEGIIHKIFYSYVGQLNNIQNSKLENAVKTLGNPFYNF